MFIDCLEDAFLIQHVTEPIRWRSVLDLVITSEPDIVDKVNVLGAFSDRNLMHFSTNVLVNIEETAPDF